ncbi:MAG: hypothetical protein L0H41_08200 [Microlunatus sp.]|nr:hypothetical protein [Microlunatus sp.]MDN5804440.1 hypothetical protein [Microlunatus sp.]
MSQPGPDEANVNEAGPDETEVAQAAVAAAGIAYERVMSGVADELASVPPNLEPADALRWAGDRLTELLAGFAEFPLDRLMGLNDARPGTAETVARGEPVQVRATAGSSAETRIWVHVIGPLTQATVRFSLTDLVPAVGDSLPGCAAAFEPTGLSLPAPAGASTVLRYRIPTGTAPGHYHGLVVGRGVADAVVPVTVEVV